jgi:hypothetical protein
LKQISTSGHSLSEYVDNVNCYTTSVSLAFLPRIVRQTQTQSPGGFAWNCRHTMPQIQVESQVATCNVTSTTSKCWTASTRNYKNSHRKISRRQHYIIMMSQFKMEIETLLIFQEAVFWGTKVKI